MATPITWSGVSVAMQSAIAATATITAITKANPGVVTATNTLVNGDYVYLSVLGMSQLNGVVARVSAASGTGFTLEGVDTTAFDTFASGTFQKLTLGNTIATMTTISSSGGDFDFIDTTTIHDLVKTQIPGTSSAIAYTFDNIWDPSDAGFVAMKAASDIKAQRAFLFTWPNGKKMVFSGFVGASGAPGGSAQALVTTQATITAFGRPVYYNS